MGTVGPAPAGRTAVRAIQHRVGVGRGRLEAPLNAVRVPRELNSLVRDHSISSRCPQSKKMRPPRPNGPAVPDDVGRSADPRRPGAERRGGGVEAHVGPTAYRYFPTQEALLLETTFLGDSETLRGLPELTRDSDDPAEGVAEAVRRGAEWTLEREARLRMVLRASLDPSGETRAPPGGADTSRLLEPRAISSHRVPMSAYRRAHAPVRDRPDHLAGRQQRRPARADPRRPRVDGAPAGGRGAGRVGALAHAAVAGRGVLPGHFARKAPHPNGITFNARRSPDAERTGG